MYCSPRAGLYQRAEGWEVVQPVPQRAACLPGQRGWTQLGLHDCSLHRCSTGFMFSAKKQQHWLLHIKLLTLISVIFQFFSVSENKVLCHPSSVDSLSTSAATEDHVSMGGWAARKALRVVEHVEQGKPFPLLHPPSLFYHRLLERPRCLFSVLAIELLAGCQGIEFLRPLRTTTPLEKVYELVRSVVK